MKTKGLEIGDEYENEDTDRNFLRKKLMEKYNIESQLPFVDPNMLMPKKEQFPVPQARDV